MGQGIDPIGGWGGTRAESFSQSFVIDNCRMAGEGRPRGHREMRSRVGKKDADT